MRAKLAGVAWMAKPHIRRAVSFDCGWKYTHWTCYEVVTDIRATGSTPHEAYKRWLMQCHLKGWYLPPRHIVA